MSKVVRNIHVQILCGHVFSLLGGIDLRAELLGHAGDHGLTF